MSRLRILCAGESLERLKREGEKERGRERGERGREGERERERREGERERERVVDRCGYIGCFSAKQFRSSR